MEHLRFFSSPQQGPTFSILLGKFWANLEIPNPAKVAQNPPTSGKSLANISTPDDGAHLPHDLAKSLARLGTPCRNYEQTRWRISVFFFFSPV
jgi:hypothetical protein